MTMKITYMKTMQQWGTVLALAWRCWTCSSRTAAPTSTRSGAGSIPSSEGRKKRSLRGVSTDSSAWCGSCPGRVKLSSKPSIPFRVFSAFPTTWEICSSLDAQPPRLFQIRF